MRRPPPISTRPHTRLPSTARFLSRDRFVQYIQQEPMAAAQLRAPLYEDKVVDFLFSKAAVSDRKASRAELEADLESEEGHVHRSEEKTSELQSLMRISYAVFCLKTKTHITNNT